MTFLDADVIVTDRRFPGDPRRPGNRDFLDRLRDDGYVTGMAAHTLLEVVGVLSHNTATADIPALPVALCRDYSLRVVPDPVVYPDYAGCTFEDLIRQMAEKMSLGDALAAVQIDKFAPAGSEFVTWNAKHFRGKFTVPVLTPAEWLVQNPPAAGPTP